VVSKALVAARIEVQPSLRTSTIMLCSLFTAVLSKSLETYNYKYFHFLIRILL